MGSVRLATTVNAASGQPISIPLSVLQIPSSGGPVQLIGSVSKATAGAVGSAMTVPQRQNISANTQIVVPANNQNSGSLLAQQQHLQMTLQRQVQIQLQQKMAAKLKTKPQQNS